MRLFIILLLVLVVSSCQTNKNSQPITNQVQQNSTPTIVHDLKDSVRINLSIFIRREVHSLAEYKMLKNGDTVNYPSRGMDSEMQRVRMFRSNLSLLDKDTLRSMAKLTFYSEDNKEIKSESTRLMRQEAELSSGCCTSGTSRAFVSEAYHAKMTHFFPNNEVKDSIEVYIKF